MKKEINWGIIGLGKIAGKFAKDISSVSNARLYGVASRNLDKAENFKDQHKASKAYGSYEELIDDKDIDAVYIATPHSMHAELSIKCLQNKKAVLCEKPFAMNTREAEKVIQTAIKEEVFLMEALWTAFLPHYQYAKEIIDSGKFGNIKSLTADFGFIAPFHKDARLFNKDLGGGSLLDIGIYPIFMAYSLLGMPENIKAEADFSETGVDERCRIKFNYSKDRIASLYSTFREDTPTEALIELENASIKLNSRFHEPSSVTIIENDKETLREFPVETIGYNFETQHVTDCLLNSRKESELWTHQNTLDLMHLLDSVRNEIGLKY